MFINIDSMLQNTKESDSRVSHQMHESGFDARKFTESVLTFYDALDGSLFNR